jgi:uncharacterized protein with HEPN domain
MSRDWKLYLSDIVRCCERVRRYTAGMTQQQFLADDRTYDAVVRNLEVIGEAVKGLPQEVRQQMPNIEWPKIAGMRDWLAHAYFGIDDDILWDVVANRVAPLEQTVRTYQSAVAQRPSAPEIETESG